MGYLGLKTHGLGLSLFKGGERLLSGPCGMFEGLGLQGIQGVWSSGPAVCRLLFSF